MYTRVTANRGTNGDPRDLVEWRDGDMRKRWCAAGLLRAESKFRRVRGCRAMPTLLKALETLVREQRAGSKQRVA
jgi:hypothetical protein